MEKKVTSIIAILLVIISIALFIVLPKKDFSDIENRYLSKPPKLSLNSIANGQFFESIDNYISDHFAFRNTLIGLKGDTEKIIGKEENNNVFITENQLFSRIEPPNEDLVAGNIQAIKDFSIKNGVKPYISVISSASEIQSEGLPRFAYSTVFSQTEFLDQVFLDLDGSVQNIDINKALKKSSNEDIFYQTDHHWTSKGAYLSYIETGKYFNYIGFDLDLFTIINVSNEFYGTLYSKSGYHNIKPDTIKQYTTQQFHDSFKSFTEESSKPPLRHETVFFDENLLIKDKYLYFTGENRAVSTVKTNLSGEEKILIFKDSFANCYLPFLVPHFSEITMVDLRYVTDTYLDLVDINDYDYIYILYSIETFITSNDLLKIGG